MNTKFLSVFLYSTAFYVLYHSKNQHIESLKEYVFTNLKNIYDVWNESSTEPVSEENNDEIFIPKELEKYENLENGLYLSILGKVYDVSSGSKFYGPGGTYNGFVGRDASLAFITGDFTEEGLTDDLSSLSESQVLSLYNWVSFYEENYVYKGKLAGRYYDQRGNPTEEFNEILNIVERARVNKLKEERRNVELPPCNVEWTADLGTKVWCTHKSGGVTRDWVGVPRILFEGPNAKQNRCACVKLDSKEYQENQGKLGEYEGCDKSSTSCIVQVTEQR